VLTLRTEARLGVARRKAAIGFDVPWLVLTRWCAAAFGLARHRPTRTVAATERAV